MAVENTLVELEMIEGRVWCVWTGVLDTHGQLVGVFEALNVGAGRQKKR